MVRSLIRGVTTGSNVQQRLGLRKACTESSGDVSIHYCAPTWQKTLSRTKYRYVLSCIFV